MSRVSTINYMGTSILFLDFSKISTAEVPAVINEARRVIDRASPNSLKIMTDFTDANYDNATADMVKSALSLMRSESMRKAVGQVRKRFYRPI